MQLWAAINSQSPSITGVKAAAAVVVVVVVVVPVNVVVVVPVNTRRPRQNGRQFPDDIFKCMFLNEDI